MTSDRRIEKRSILALVAGHLLESVIKVDILAAKAMNKIMKKKSKHVLQAFGESSVRQGSLTGPKRNQD